jgi:hypothetical protein
MHAVKVHLTSPVWALHIVRKDELELLASSFAKAKNLRMGERRRQQPSRTPKKRRAGDLRSSLNKSPARHAVL